MAKDKPVNSSGSKSDKPAKSKPSEESGGNEIWQDARFQHLLTDPRFRNLPKKHRKVKIDKRFQGMFTDEKFKVKYTVDKYGRRVNTSNAEDLRKFYEIDSEEDDAESGTETSDINEEEKERRAEELAISRQSNDNSINLGNDALESDGEEVPSTIRERLLDPQIDYARGEGVLATDSSSGDESSTDEDDNDPMLKIDHVWGELDCDAETTDESTRRLAVCNMDWDRIRAQDIMVMLSSFLPPGGSVLSVKIYPSEFGKERLAKEEIHGPPELVGMGESEDSYKNAENSVSDTDTSDDELVKEQDSDAEEGDDYHMEKLRQYQLNRLRYYYAVVECDTIQTADKLYKECDGIEYESSATRVDLRFIPDDVTFDEDEPTDICTELPDANSYKPRQFTTTALQQAKVDLTWDETALDRRELGDKLSSGKLDQISDKDLCQIVAYSSEEEADEANEPTNNNMENNTEPDKVIKDDSIINNDKPSKKNQKVVIDKYKALLAEINENEKKRKQQKYEMEFSWDVNEEKEQQKSISQTDENANKSKQKLTPIEKVLQKRSEKNKQRKEERRRKKLEAQGIDPNANNSDEDSIPDGIDMNDPYFAEEFANGDYVEPKKANTKSKSKRQKKTLQKNDSELEEEERKAKELELLLDDDDVDAAGKQHFSLDKILKSEQTSTSAKRKRRKQLKKKLNEKPQTVDDSFQINVADPRFSAVYSSPNFNIDPTNSHFKKTKGMELIIQEKLKRRHERTDSEVGHTETLDLPKRPKKQLDNSLLVKSIKRKIQIKNNK